LNLLVIEVEKFQLKDKYLYIMFFIIISIFKKAVEQEKQNLLAFKSI
jgi:hypothetical protein